MGSNNATPPSVPGLSDEDKLNAWAASQGFSGDFAENMKDKMRADLAGAERNGLTKILETPGATTAGTKQEWQVNKEALAELRTRVQAEQAQQQKLSTLQNQIYEQGLTGLL